MTDRTPTTAAGRAFVALYEPKDRGVQAEWVATIETEARAAPDPAPLDVERLARALRKVLPRRGDLVSRTDWDNAASAILSALEEPTP